MKKIIFLIILTLVTTSTYADKLLKNGFLDGHMNYSKNQDINIIYDDALNTMSNFDDQSFNVISSFHMIEHLDQQYYHLCV